MKLYYTSPSMPEAAQSKPSLSLGGFKSSSPVPNDTFSSMFSDISMYTVKNSNGNKYVGLVLVNETGADAFDVKIWFEYTPHAVSYFKVAAIDMGVDSDGNLFMERIPDNSSKPLYSEFVEADGDTNKADIGDIPAGSSVGIWLERVLDTDAIKTQQNSIYAVDPTDPYKYVPVELEKVELVNMKISYEDTDGIIYRITTITSMITNSTGSNVFITFDNPMIDPASFLSDFTMRVNGVTITIDSVALANGADNIYVLSTSYPILYTDVIEVDIAYGNIKDALPPLEGYSDGLPIAAVTGYQVTNNVTGIVTPSIQIFADNTTVTSGTTVNFVSNVLNGGNSPTYQWFKNGLPLLGENNSSYSYSPMNGDAIYCELTSSLTNVTSPTATSSTITLAVVQMVDRVADPIASLPSGEYGSYIGIAFTTQTAGATIRYTMDGSVPTSLYGDLYTPGSYISVTANKTVKAVAYKENMVDSNVTTFEYTFTVLEQLQPVFITPVLTDPWPHSSAIQVYLICYSAGVTIRYTTDGSTPTVNNGAIYTDYFTVDRDTTVKAFAYKEGSLPTEVAEYSYIFAKRNTGLLYNKYAAVDPLLAPAGWRVASAEDWGELNTFAGPYAGTLLKAVSWGGSYTTDQFGFKAVPNGTRGFNQSVTAFIAIDAWAAWWTSDAYSEYSSTYVLIQSNNSQSILQIIAAGKGLQGRGVRLVKENPNTWVSGDTVTDADGNVYETTKIGNQVWTKSNYKCTKLNTGVAIDNFEAAVDWGVASGPAYCHYDGNLKYE